MQSQSAPSHPVVSSKGMQWNVQATAIFVTTQTVFLSHSACSQNESQCHTSEVQFSTTDGTSTVFQGDFVPQSSEWPADYSPTSTPPMPPFTTMGSTAGGLEDTPTPPFTTMGSTAGGLGDTCTPPVPSFTTMGSYDSFMKLHCHRPMPRPFLPSPYLSSFYSPSFYSPLSYLPSPLPHSYSSFPTLSTSIRSGHPFFVQLITGNIRTCQGCPGSLRESGGKVPPTPYNVAIAQLEHHTFFDKTTGTWRTSRKESYSHYHFRLSCIWQAEPSF